jgi:hypothetical protein
VKATGRSAQIPPACECRQNESRGSTSRLAVRPRVAASKWAVGNRRAVWISVQAFEHYSISLLKEAGAMFGPFYSAVFLAFESSKVWSSAMKIMSGGSGSHETASKISIPTPITVTTVTTVAIVNTDTSATGTNVELNALSGRRTGT